MAGCWPLLRGQVLVGVAPSERAGSGSGLGAAGLRSVAPDRTLVRTRRCRRSSPAACLQSQASPRFTASRFYARQGSQGGHPRPSNPGHCQRPGCLMHRVYRAYVVFL